MTISKAALCLPVGLDAPGFLSVPTATGDVTIRLSASQTNLLVQLVQARQRHASYPQPCMGWMTARLIGQLMGGGPKGYVVEAESVRKYVGRIREKVRRHLGPDATSFDLFERLPLLGYRLAVAVELFGAEPLAA
jgi:hypothetical protein